MTSECNDRKYMIEIFRASTFLNKSHLLGTQGHFLFYLNQHIDDKKTRNPGIFPSSIIHQQLLSNLDNTLIQPCGKVKPTGWVDC